MNDISVLSVVKDAEKHIRKMLYGVKSLAREIIIIDTGSTDNTVEICKEYGAKVICDPQEWRNNLVCDNKNEGLKHCRYDWVCCVDADEEVSEPLSNEMILFARQEKFSALRVSRINFFPTFPSTRDRVVRMFRRSRGYVFRSLFHKYNHETPLIVEENNGFGEFINTDNSLFHWAWINITLSEYLNKKEKYLDFKYGPFMVLDKEFGLTR